jgi:hypothetical protein
MGLKVARLDLYRARVMSFRLGIPFQLAQGVGEATMKGGTGAVDGEGPVDRRDRGIEGTTLQCQDAKKMMRVGIVGLQFEGLPISILGVVKPA